MMKALENNAWVAPLLQVSDPLFPTGGYAHSLGFEQWAYEKAYDSKEDLKQFFLNHAGPALMRQEFPYLQEALIAFAEEDFETIIQLDEAINAWKWASEIREASIAQGRGRLRLLKQMWGEDKSLNKYAELFDQGKVMGHHLIVSALQYKILSVPNSAALFAYGYQTLATYISASIKLLRISPESAQDAMHFGLDHLSQWVEDSNAVSVSSAGWFAPLYDIYSARHKTAFSRLFIS